jgi:thiol-disulfide isomerase/thioredoxin
MKKITLIAFAMTFLLSCNSNKVNQDSFEITGKIKGLGDESMVLSYRFESTTYLDTITATNDMISFKKEIIFPNPVWATLTYIGERELEQRSTQFFIDNGVRIVLEGDLENLDALKAKNSPFFSDVMKLREENRELTQELLALGRQTSRNAAELGEEELRRLNERRRELSEKISENTRMFIENNRHSIYAAYLYSTTLTRKTAEEVEAELNKFTDEVRNSAFGGLIRKYIEGVRRTAPGAQAPNFKQEDINGDIVTLEQFRGQYVMLVFWGSWCGPCRRSHPHLMELLNKYKDSPLQVIGFASDRDKDQWRKAIEADKLDFIHCNLFDRLNGENVQDLYNIRNYPTKVIIDPQGKIVAFIVGAGPDEKKQLEDIFKNAFGK